MTNDPSRQHFETRAIHAGQSSDPENGALMTPVYLNSTYQQDAPAQPRGGYEYSRTSNPTRTALEANLASLESGSWALSEKRKRRPRLRGRLRPSSGGLSLLGYSTSNEKAMQMGPHELVKRFEFAAYAAFNAALGVSINRPTARVHDLKEADSSLDALLDALLRRRVGPQAAVGK